MLKMGSSGDDVAKLQKRLAAAGFDPGAADGIFGAKTEAALKAFQESMGIDADGIAGPATNGKFAEAAAAAMEKMKGFGKDDKPDAASMAKDRGFGTSEKKADDGGSSPL